jgi:site-specific DNA-methyltransferase (adenine-specific)
MTLILGDCLLKVGAIESSSVSSVVTDPPYGISFLGNKWDYDVPSIDIWKECFRALKPGGYLLSFSSARTYHKIASAIEDAGFEIRDQLMWVYGQGMPKGDNLKPAHEPIVLARKPGKSKLNVDQCRVPLLEGEVKPWVEGEYATNTTVGSIRGSYRSADKHPDSRYPANFIHDGSIHEKWARFFYCAKDRSGVGHPTVKPLKLMEYLVKLVTPENGIVLDPFMGSGTTGVAALTLNRKFIGIERDDKYFEIASQRIANLSTNA